MYHQHDLPIWFRFSLFGGVCCNHYFKSHASKALGYARNSHLRFSPSCRIKLHKLQYGKDLVFSEMKPPSFEGDSLGK